MQILLCLLVILGVSLTCVAKEVQLVGKGGTYQGEIQRVRNSTVLLKERDGRYQSFPLHSLNAAGQQIVRSWIQKKGGTEKYASWIGSGERSFAKAWPRGVYGPKSIQLKLVQKLTKKQPLIYESKHFRFVIDSKVEPKVARRFAVLFETTYKYVLALPLNASGQYLVKEKKFPIYLFSDLSNYHRAGGPQGSAGVFMPRSGSVLVPMVALGVQWDGRRWELLKKENNAVLAHELTHQLTNGPSFAPWYLEGSAEYVAATRYNHGMYHGGKSSTKQRAFDYVRSKKGLEDGSGRRLGGRFPLMPLERFMNLPYSEFAGFEANKNYAVGLLLTQYFYHKHGRGDGAAIKKYIKAIQQGEGERSAQKHLLAGKSYAKLQEDFRRFCAQGGIAIDFEK